LIELLVDCPASCHNNAARIAFADGHLEIHKWLDSRTIPPQNIDMLWMQQHSNDLVNR